VIDSSSIEVSRRARRAKTDRLDLGGLLTLLARFVQGDRRLWHVVRVPSVTEEDARHLPRTIEAVTQHRTRLINRVKGLLATHGVRCRVDANFLRTIGEVRLWDGTPLPPGLDERLRCEWAQLKHLEQQRRALKAARTKRQRDLTTTHGRTMTQLLHVRGVGPTSATMLTAEIFGWRQIRNRRQLGALVGLRTRPLSKWRDAAGSGHHARGPHACAPRHHAGRVGVDTTSAAQCADTVVSTPLWGRWETHAARRHRRPGAQTADCTLALS
jgi:transposase